MLICLEGVDRGGKSTLARELQRLHGGPSIVYHQGPPPPTTDLVELYERPLLDPAFRERALDPEDLVVLDRWETGELVYGPLFRGASRLSPGQALHVDLVLRSLGAVRVLAQPRAVGVVKQRHLAHGDDLLAYHDVERVHEFYEAAARAGGWYRAAAVDDPFDVGPHYTRRPDDLLALAARTALVAREIDGFPGYAGARWPVVLYVGDRRADGPKAVRGDWTNKAFTPLGGLSSSRWLLDALAQGLQWQGVGLVNSVEPGLDLLALWKALETPRVVALGNLAARRLEALGVPHGKVCHPQFARRFRAKDFQGYASELAKEAKSDWEQLVPLPNG